MDVQVRVRSRTLCGFTHVVRGLAGCAVKHFK
jgi:hypothetical protein